MKQLLVVLLLILFLLIPANAQTFRGAINGTVTDPSGASVPGATVKAPVVRKIPVESVAISPGDLGAALGALGRSVAAAGTR